MMRVRVVQSANTGLWRWEIVAANGSVIGSSERPNERKSRVVEQARSIAEDAMTLQIFSSAA
jgi:uncharacterized protein YegP (UPF0339 family)